MSDAYACRDCGAPASLVGGVIVRSCECRSVVVVSMSATVSQHGGTSERGMRGAVLAALRDVMERLRG